MSRKWRLVFWSYAAVAAATLALFVHGAYQNGGFQLHHGVAEFFLIATVYLAGAILWPALIVWVILIALGVERRHHRALAPARRLQALEQQCQHGVGPGRQRRIAPFIGMSGMMEADGGVKNRPRRGVGVGDLERALLHAI
jgi:hypothetical protein